MKNALYGIIGVLLMTCVYLTTQAFNSTLSTPGYTNDTPYNADVDGTVTFGDLTTFSWEIFSNGSCNADCGPWQRYITHTCEGNDNVKWYDAAACGWNNPSGNVACNNWTCCVPSCPAANTICSGTTDTSYSGCASSWNCNVAWTKSCWGWGGWSCTAWTACSPLADTCDSWYTWNPLGVELPIILTCTNPSWEWCMFWYVNWQCVVFDMPDIDWWCGLCLGHPGLWSDIRIKTNIEFYAIENGYNTYIFEYKKQPWVKYIGVMAQEILEITPDAVLLWQDWYYSVYYDMLWVDFRLLNE